MPVNNDNYICPQTHSLSVPRDLSATVLPRLYILAPPITTKPDKWVHQAKYWDLVSRMGMWHQHKDDAFRCLRALVCMRAHTSMCHLSMCKCVIPLVYGLWQCWWVSLSSLIAAPADGLWIWQEGRGKKKCRKSHLWIGNGWEACGPHQPPSVPRHKPQHRASYSVLRSPACCWTVSVPSKSVAVSTFQ